MRETKEDKSLFEKYLNNSFVDIEHSIPRFQQEFFDLQNEYYKMWKNFVLTNITLQKEVTSKIGLSSQVPQAYQKVIETMTEESVKMVSMRNQIYATWFDTAKKNIKILNNNSEMFMENYKKLIDFWTNSQKK